MRGESIYAVDIGTMWARVAQVKARPVILRDVGGEPQVPAVVHFQGSHATVGTKALARAVTEPGHTVRGVVRMLGRTPDDPQVRRLTVDRGLRTAPHPTDGLRIELGGDFEHTPVTIASALLRGVPGLADAHDGEVMLTVPSWFGERARIALLRAANVAGLRPLGLVPDVVAAACPLARDAERTLAIVDVGAGGISVGLLRVGPGRVLVLSIVADRAVGGEEVDTALAAAAQQGLAAEGATLTDGPGAAEMLRHSVEELKRELAEARSAERSVRFATGPHASPQIAIDHEMLREAAGPLLDHLRRAIAKALQESAVAPKDIDELLLCGGSSRLEAVIECASGALGLAPRLRADPSIVFGAALLAAGRFGDGAPIEVSGVEWMEAHLAYAKNEAVPTTPTIIKHFTRTKPPAEPVSPEAPVAERVRPEVHPAEPVRQEVPPPEPVRWAMLPPEPVKQNVPPPKPEKREVPPMPYRPDAARAVRRSASGFRLPQSGRTTIPMEILSGRFFNPSTPEEFLAMPLHGASTGIDPADIALPVLLRRALGRRRNSGMLTLEWGSDGLVMPIVRGLPLVTAGDVRLLKKAILAPAGTWRFDAGDPSTAGRTKRTMRSLIVEACRTLFSRWDAADVAAALGERLALVPEVLEAHEDAIGGLGLSDQEMRAIKNRFGAGVPAQQMIGSTRGGAGLMPRLLVLLESFGVLRWDPVVATEEVPIEDILEREAKRMEAANHFDALGIHWSADSQEVSLAYAVVPERAPPPGSSPRAREAWDRILRRAEAAYGVLVDDSRRIEYRCRIYPARDFSLTTEILAEKVRALELHADKREVAEARRCLKEVRKSVNPPTPSRAPRGSDEGDR